MFSDKICQMNFVHLYIVPNNVTCRIYSGPRLYLYERLHGDSWFWLYMLLCGQWTMLNTGQTGDCLVLVPNSGRTFPSSATNTDGNIFIVTLK